MSPGELLAMARRAAGLTQEQLAIRAGTGQSAISQIEPGEVEPSFSRLRSLIRLTGHELEATLSVRPIALVGQLLMESLRMTPEKRISASIQLSTVSGELRREGQRALERDQSELLRELAGL